MDGFLRSGKKCNVYSIGHYQEADLTFFGALARQYTSLDRYFCSFLGPTYPNLNLLTLRQTDRISNTPDVCQLETIWDRLKEAVCVTARCYSGWLGLWGSEYENITYSYQNYLDDAAAGQLPAVSFVDPTYSTVTGATDDHPFTTSAMATLSCRRRITPWQAAHVGPTRFWSLPLTNGAVSLISRLPAQSRPSQQH